MTALLNSNEDFAVDDTFVVDLTYVRPPRGTGRRKLGSDAFANMVKSKHSCIEITNKDDLCCARALVTARAYQHKDQSALHLSEYTTLRHGGALQTTKARELHRLAKVPEGACGLPEIREFEKVLPDYQLIVVSADHGNAIVHCGPTALHPLILLAHQGHYDVITKLNAYFGVAYFCLRCRKGYNTKDFRHHRCPGFKCYCCQQTDCSDFATHPARDAATELCPHCHRRFFGPRCLELHTLRSPSGARVHPLTFDNVCAQLRCCGHCGRTFQSYQAFLSHLCGYQPCYNCGLTVDVWDHRCFIQAIPLRRGPKRKHPSTATQPGPEEQAVVKIFFDCECMQEGGEAHRVNLVCAETSLDDQRYQFPSMQEFMAWVWRLKVTDPSRRPFVVIAHNFQGYDGTFVKAVKQEADGWPSPEVAKDPALQIEYLEEFRRVEGVILDPAKIERNEGRRTLGKLMANSFWGKFGQRTNKTQVTTCKDPESFFDLFLDGERDIHRILPAGEQMIDVYHSFKEDVGELGTNTNIFVAAFTTAHARVKLYHDGLLPLHTRVLYMDTDSVVYLATQGETHLPRGRFLGQFKDELKGDVIDEFVAGGPKNYAYRTRSGQECCKVRGFTLDARGQAVLNFESVRNLVQLDMTEPLDRPRTLSVDNPHHIVRNVPDKTLHSVPQRKTYSMVQDKRVLEANTGMTYPYGYRPSQDIVDDMVLSVLFSDIDSPLEDYEEDLPLVPEPYSC
ncbi:unnamed protein product [Porites lobata]|uniref:DNA-directed DNA polymerase n=1 Tax=Porites lobata TaxID=104759 RepID=A0ABN8P083_9CNID|nr:unnamed protein product [Porites lobata]